MIIFVYIYILLGFLIYIPSIVYIKDYKVDLDEIPEVDEIAEEDKIREGDEIPEEGERSELDKIAEKDKTGKGGERPEEHRNIEEDETDGDKTPTNPKSVNYDDDKTPTEELNDISFMKNSKNIIKELKNKDVVNRLEKGLPIDNEDKENLDNLKEEYSSYFDEDSENTIEEGLDQIDEYLDGELNTFYSKGKGKGIEPRELDKELTKIKDLEETEQKDTNSAKDNDLSKSNEPIQEVTSSNEGVSEIKSSSSLTDKSGVLWLT